MELIQSLPRGCIPSQSSTHTHKHMIGLSQVEHTCDFPGTWRGICLVYAHFWMTRCPFAPLLSKYLIFEKQKNTPRQATKDAAIKGFQQALAKPRSVCVLLQPVHSSSKQMQRGLGGTESNKVLLCCYTALQFQASALTHIFWESNRKSLISFFYLHGKPNIAISYISVSWFYVDKIWWQGDLLFSQTPPPPPPLSLLHHCRGQ